jgi:hypothetical protein
MTLTQLAPPYPIFTDKSGSPLDNGYLYFGTANLNPETNPITVYYDNAFTQPAAQPLRTSNGYVMRNGSPALIYANSQFSVTVRDKNRAMVIYSPVGYGITPGSSTSFASQISIVDAGNYYTSSTVEDALQELGGTKYPKSLAVLLANTTLTYTAGGPNSVSTGDIIQTLTEGYSYQVAASGASDQHITTAGGVKLYEANYFTTKDRVKRQVVSSLSNGASTIAKGTIYEWDATVPVQVHQADPRQTVFIAPNPATNGAWVMDYEKPSIPAFDQVKMKMVRQRVDFVGIGDSNQLFGGYGWDTGFAVALQAIAPTFGTGLTTMYAANGDGSGEGYGWSTLRIGQTFATTGAPASVQKYLSKGSGDLGPMDPAYLASGTASDTAQLGIGIDPSWAGGVQNALRYDAYTVTFNSGSGQFRLFHRLSNNTAQERGSTISTNTGVLGNLVKSSLTRSARTAPAFQTQFMLNQLGYTDAPATPIIGPFFNTFERVTVPTTTTGWALSTLYARGGQSLRDAAYALQQASDDTLIHFFSILRADQFETGAENACIAITVNFGLNDRNETLPSVGPAAISPGDSAAAYVDNFVALQQRIQGIWTSQGWPLSELAFLMFPSHPVSTPDDAELLAYRNSVGQYISLLPQTQFFNLEEITSSTEMLANNWYASSGADRNHLTQTGYEQLGARIIALTE